MYCIAWLDAMQYKVKENGNFKHKALYNVLSTYFDYTEPIRKIIYTTNAAEGFHRQVRKVTKTKGAFISDMALQKMMYLTIKNIQKKRLHRW